MAYPDVMVGIDGTRQALEAARQAAALVDRAGRLQLVGVEDAWDALAGSWAGTMFGRLDGGTEWTYDGRRDELRRRIDASLAYAAAHIDAPCAVETRRVEGRPWETLPQLAAKERPSLLAVGTHGGSRARGILLGYTATSVAHEPHCSMLIARPPFDPRSFPQSLAVGYDGSPQSELALDAAIAIAEGRPELRVRIVTCPPTPPGLAREAAMARAPVHFTFEDDWRLPDDGLVEASQSVDLLVLGSRALHGVAAIGSTSERVAHRAASSVLIVR